MAFWQYALHLYCNVIEFCCTTVFLAHRKGLCRMKEDLLHYIWRTQQFNKEGLQTDSGEHVEIVKVGKLNKDAGPDFLDGSIKIGHVAWRGDIEVHLKSSDWYAHKHEVDSRYNSVVLHVVWEDNKKVIRSDGTFVPTLALKGRVQKKLLQRYEVLIEHPTTLIPCSSQLPQVSKAIYSKMLAKALLQRFSHKSHFVNKLLRRNHYDTEATAYHLLGYNFGFKVNSETFLELVQRVPLRLLDQHRPNLLYLEALLLGQAGLLPSLGRNDELEQGYAQELVESYMYLKRKHRLAPTIEQHSWKFCRLRPANFPTIRIVQFARLVHLHPQLFSLLVNSTPAQLKTRFAIRPSTYWQDHYLIGKKATVRSED